MLKPSNKYLSVDKSIYYTSGNYIILISDFNSSYNNNTLMLIVLVHPSMTCYDIM